MKKLLVVAAIAALAGTALAQDSAQRVKPEDVTFKPNPLLKGMESAVVIGDPSKPGVAVVRNKFPANFKVAPHTHPHGEVVTVLSGSVGFGLGDTFDPSKGEMVKAGGINVVPAKQSHFVWTGSEEAVIQVQYIGPTGIDFVNPADDPRKK
jgi:quercetin dioxygenase-like cupin family protein